MIAAANEAGIRITLLDACYLHGGFGEPPDEVQQPLLRRRRRRLGRARRQCSPPTPRASDRRGDPQRPRRRPRVVRDGRGLGRTERPPRCTLTSPNSRPRTRPASPRWAAPRSRCSTRAGALGAGVHRGPRHPPHRWRRRRARRGRLLLLSLPDDRARSRRRHRPGAGRLPTPGASLSARHRLARGDRHARGGPRGRARRAARQRRARPPPRRGATARRDRVGHAALGARRRADRGGRARRPGDDRPRLAFASPGTTTETALESVVFAATARRTSSRWSAADASSSATARHARARRWRRAARRRSPRCVA